MLLTRNSLPGGCVRTDDSVRVSAVGVDRRVNYECSRIELSARVIWSRRTNCSQPSGLGVVVEENALQAQISALRKGPGAKAICVFTLWSVN